MRRLTYYIAVSLDGFIASPTGAFDAFPTEGDHFDWIFREWTDTLPAFVQEGIGRTADNSRFDTVLMGWRTLAVGFPFGVVDPYPHLRSYVVTHHPDRELPGEPGANLVLTDEDPVALVRRLKAESGTGIWLCGGGELAATLVDEIDTLVLKVNPILLGDGRRLFASGPYAARGFELAESRSFTSGVVVSTYVRKR